MTELYGRPVSRASLSRRVGAMSQIAGARASVLASGLARGVEAVDVKTGTGFEFTVLPGRGLDIAWASYRGMPLSYIGKTGVVAPAYFTERGATGFLRNFFAGLMTTAGLSNTGGPVEVDGAEFGLHGRISNIPAEDVGVTQQWVGDDYQIRGQRNRPPGDGVRREPDPAARDFDQPRGQCAGGARHGRERELQA